MSEVEKVKRLAVSVNDFMVVAGLIVVVVVSLFTVVACAFFGTLSTVLTACLLSLAAFLFWAISSGLWCALSGIHSELKKLNSK